MLLLQSAFEGCAGDESKTGGGCLCVSLIICVFEKTNIGEI